MRTRAFGSTGREVAVIGQGTWDVRSDKRRSAVEALRVGLDLGMTHIDAAEMYGTEDLVGQAITGRRDEVFLVSKVLPDNASRQGTIAACERSLERLETDRLDCYLLHWRGRHALEQTIAAFRELTAAGKIVSWGVSNFDVADLEEAWAIDSSFVCNQVLYNLEERSIEHDVIPWCERHNVALVAYTPFGRKRFAPSHSTGGRALEEIAATHGATPRQVALAFLTRRPGTFTIPKASTADHTRENAGAGDLSLTRRELDRIGEAFPLGAPSGSLPTL